MSNERVVRREVTETTQHTVKPADTIVQPSEKVVEKRVETTETVQAQPAPPKNTNVNVSANPDPAAGGQVSINTPDGTQVNVNP